MAATYLQLLGAFRFVYAGKPIGGIDTPRLRALVAYLALHSNAPQMRHHLAFQFWPDSSEGQALTNLRKQLLHLRNALPDADAILRVERQTVQWNPDNELEIDAVAFTAHAANAVTASREQAIALLRKAVGLYQGDLLPECYDEWIIPVREQLRQRYAASLGQLVQLLEDRRDYPAAIEQAQALVRFDSLHEPSYCQLMRLHALSGDRASAVRVYHLCATALQAELGVEPGNEIRAAYERLVVQPAVSEGRSPSVASAPLVGRQVEWQKLQLAWRAAQRGNPQFVCILGEAGIGKSRLADELLNWADHQGIATAQARAFAAEGRLAYAPVIELLRAEVLQVHRNRLDAVWLTELARLLPEVTSEASSPLLRPEPITQSWQRSHLFEAVARAVLVGDKPLVVAIDDLQWCDQETVEWLHFLLRFAAGAGRSAAKPKPLLVLGTARIEEIDESHPVAALLNDLRGGEQLTELELGPLSAEETANLARSLAGEPVVNGSFRDLYQATEGNPLFVVETLRMGQWQAKLSMAAADPSNGAEPGTGKRLPAKVQAIIRSRLGQLSAEARQVAAVAAIIGREFAIDVLLATSRLHEDALANALDELWQRRIIRSHGADAYDFTHDRIREVAADSIGVARRRLLHRSVAESLEGLHAAQLDPVAGQIAAHYDHAGVLGKAIEFYRRAAQVALAVIANHEALSLLQRALALLEQLPESAERDRQEIELQLMLTVPLVPLTYYGSPAIVAAVMRAHRLSTQLNIPLDAVILLWMGALNLFGGHHQEANQYATQLLQVGQETNNSVCLTEAHYLLGVNNFWLGEFDLSRSHLEAALAQFDPKRQSEYITRYWQDPRSICLQRLAYTQLHCGYFDSSDAALEAAIAHAEALAHPFSLGYVLTFALITWIEGGNFERANRLMAKTVPFLEKHDFPHWSVMVGMLQGYIAAMQGDVDAGIAQIRAGLSIFRKRDNRNTQPLYYILLAQACARANAPEDAFAALQDCLDEIKQTEERWILAEVHRLHGEFLLQFATAENLPASQAEAEAYFTRALEIARQQNGKYAELRAALSLGRLWQSQGQPAKAHHLLAQVYGWFTEGFDIPEMVEARALLEQLSAPGQAAAVAISNSPR